jgi:hypothetical protein
MSLNYSQQQLMIKALIVTELSCVCVYYHTLCLKKATPERKTLFIGIMIPKVLLHSTGIDALQQAIPGGETINKNTYGVGTSFHYAITSILVF